MRSIAKQRYCVPNSLAPSINGKTFGLWTRQQSSSNLSNFESNHIKRIPTFVHSTVLAKESLDGCYNRGLASITKCNCFEAWGWSVMFDFSMSQRKLFSRQKPLNNIRVTYEWPLEFQRRRASPDLLAALFVTLIAAILTGLDARAAKLRSDCKAWSQVSPASNVSREQKYIVWVLQILEKQSPQWELLT